MTQYIAFDGPRLVGIGSMDAVARAAKANADTDAPSQLLVFDCVTSQPLELDLRGTLDEVLARLPVSAADGSARGSSASAASARSVTAGTDAAAAATESTRAGPGRPRLGVVAREITLLPRHWEWLSEQPGGASVTIRRLVEDARGASSERDRRRRAQESAYRFISAMLGDQPGFEEATRSLFAGDAARFATYSTEWPHDLQEHARRLAAEAFV
jgi:hypothetical protein